MMAPMDTLLLFRSLTVLFAFQAVMVQAEPIKITRSTFQNCRLGLSGNTTVDCCLPQRNLKGPIVDFIPKYDPCKPLRIRKALQCLSGTELKTYTKKLQKGYKLMRALPHHDPRSFYHQNQFHCSYGTGSLAQDSTNLTIDIHYSWFFYPWHRYFLHFHEKILQSLLGDPDFALHFWNYDNSITISSPRGSEKGCFKAGHFVPQMYNDPTKATYSEREPRAYDPKAIIDIGVTPPYPTNFTALPKKKTIARNRAAMHTTMITLGNTSRAFLGRNYSVGDSQVPPLEGTGSFEEVHASPHFWVGKLMFPANTSASDPLFFVHHGNVDRMFAIWHKLHPNFHYPTENADWMDAEFLFWDENKVLRRVKVKDSLTTEAFGYRYQEVNDASWIHFYKEGLWPSPQ